mgnify:CR=1 FL=1
MKSRLESLNFLSSVTTILLILLGANNLELGFDPQVGIREVLAKNWEFIFTIAIPSLSTFSFKLVQKIQNKELNFRTFFRNLFQSPNALTQFFTVVFSALSGLGIMFSDTVGAELANAISTGSLGLILTVVVTQVLNPILHFIMDRRNDGNGNN